jgi:hypothetical protein
MRRSWTITAVEPTEKVHLRKTMYGHYYGHEYWNNAYLNVRAIQLALAIKPFVEQRMCPRVVSQGQQFMTSN